MKKGLLGTIVGVALGAAAMAYGGLKIYNEVSDAIPHKDNEMVQIPQQEETPVAEGEIVDQ